MTRQVAVRRTLLFALLFQGVSGLAGGSGLVWDPSGATAGLPLDWLRGSPFSDYLVPGVVLVTVLGIGPLLAAYAVWVRRPWSGVAGLCVGSALVIWIGVQIAIVGYHPNPPLQAVYGCAGVAILVLGGLTMRVATEQ